MELATVWLPLAFGLLGVVVAFALYRVVVAFPVNDAKAGEIAGEIFIGAMTFMRREFSLLSIFGVLIFVLLFVGLGWKSAVAFAVGAFASAMAGYFGMRSATKANVRTALAARDRGAAAALSVSFFGGSVMGLLVASFGLLGLGALFALFGANAETAQIIQSFGVGASAVALFFRVGGGIFTKAADVGSDLVGKVEAGIPEDDPRNPGVIADNVGDNVGDVAGMGSDIFESNVGSIIATMAIATTAAVSMGAGAVALGGAAELLFLPLGLAGFGLLASIAAIFLVRAVSSMDPATALRVGTFASSAIFIAIAFFLVRYLEISMGVFWAVVAGSVGGIVIGLVTEYYTGGSPIPKLAETGKTGVATVIIAGLALGLQSVFVPVVGIAIITLIASQAAGLYGVGIAAVGMLATVGFTMAIDGYGPIADNAGGIAEMAGMGKETREITDSLDALGNTTAAIGKGFAIGSASLAALTIIAAFIQSVDVTLSLGEPRVIMGLLIGGAIPALVAAITMNSVGDAAFAMINEIRRQFREIPGLLEGTGKPDTASCVDIATTAALRKMILPGAIALFSPVVVGFVFGPEVLGGMLAGSLLSGVILALTMANAGGAWDNAKKYVEQGNLGGKGSEVHAANVVGDTVGDPLKDTSGPSLNILIKLMAIVSLTIAPLLGSSLF